MTFRIGKSNGSAPAPSPKPPPKAVLPPPRPSPQSNARDVFESPKTNRPTLFRMEALGNGQRNERLEQHLRADRLHKEEGKPPAGPPPEWKYVEPGGGFFSATGVRMENAQRNEPVQVLRELSDSEDNALDAVAGGTWYEVCRQDGTTAFVYEERLSPIQADSSVAGLASPELGAPVTPMLPAEGGGFVQQFENGSIAIDAEGNKTVTGADGGVLARLPAGTVSSVAEADAHHVTQRATREPDGEITGNAYNDYDDPQLWDGYNDCGPTSVLIAASLVGAEAHPTAAEAQGKIDEVRDLAFGVDTTDSRLTGATRLTATLQALGAGATEHTPSSMAAIDAALERGNPVIAGGQPFDSGAWGATTEGYLEDGGSFSHWVVVSGRTPEGNYIINDPLSANGPIEVTREQLEAYLDPSMGMVEASPGLPAAGS